VKIACHVRRFARKESVNEMAEEVVKAAEEMDRGAEEDTSVLDEMRPQDAKVRLHA
jgi:hypothetical protein